MTSGYDEACGVFLRAFPGYAAGSRLDGLRVDGEVAHGIPSDAMAQ